MVTQLPLVRAVCVSPLLLPLSPSDSLSLCTPPPAPGKVPVLVDFWAPWCGPCRMIAPLIDELAEEYGPKLKCLKLNTDESPSVATEYGIRSIPTVMVFKGGQKLDTVIGAVPKSTLTSIINKCGGGGGGFSAIPTFSGGVSFLISGSVAP